MKRKTGKTAPKAASVDDEFWERAKYISAALRACTATDTPVGLRLEKIIALYNHFYGKDHFNEMPITDEAEIIALLLDRVDIDRETLCQHAPDMVKYHERYKRSGVAIDIDLLHNYLAPELDRHLKRYGLVKELPGTG
jgi:hypothetical protein